MKIKIKEIEIPSDDPFKNDALERKDSAEIIGNLLSTIDEPFVICIDSPWGTGKTTFIKMLLKNLENKNFPAIYFNAWENDFSDDALLSLISEIDEGINSLKVKFGLKNQTIQKLNTIKKIGSKFVKKALPVALKIATSGIIDINQASQDSISSLVEKVTEEEIERYENSKKNLKEFKTVLTDLVSTLSESEKCKDKPLIIFIDELDRCRPTFAIEILEKVKHFFNIKGIIFVLSLDKDQIFHSIKSIYGLGMNVNGYLKRFIDLDYNLPHPPKEKFVQYLFDKYEFQDFFNKRKQSEFIYDWEQIEFIFSEMSYIFNLSLREQEQCFTQLCLAIRMTPLNNYLFSIPLSFLIILKFVNKEFYYSFIEYRIKPEEVINFIKSKGGNSEFLDNNYGYALVAYLIWLSHKNGNDRINLKVYEEIITNPASNIEDRNKAQRIVEVFNSFNNTFYRWYPDHILQVIKKKIEILEHFVSQNEL